MFGLGALGVRPPAVVGSQVELPEVQEVVAGLGGGVDLGKLGRGLIKSLAPAPAPSSLAEEMRAGLADYDGPVHILLATADRTAQVFEASWGPDSRIARCEGAGHAYDRAEHREWLDAQILAALRA